MLLGWSWKEPLFLSLRKYLWWKRKLCWDTIPSLAMLCPLIETKIGFLFFWPHFCFSQWKLSSKAVLQYQYDCCSALKYVYTNQQVNKTMLFLFSWPVWPIMLGAWSSPMISFVPIPPFWKLPVAKRSNFLGVWKLGARKRRRSSCWFYWMVSAKLKGRHRWTSLWS